MSNPTLGSFTAVVSLVWLLSVVAGGLSLRWTLMRRPGGSVAGLLSAAGSLALAWLGLSRFHLETSKTVNGRLMWSLDSKWFFQAACVLAATALLLAVWKRLRLELVP